MASDTFTDTDETLLSAHTATPSGGSWLATNEVDPAIGVIRGNIVGCVDPGTGYYGGYYDGSSADESQIVFKAAAATASSYRLVCVRMSSTRSGYGAALAVNVTDFYRLYITKDGNATAFVALSPEIDAFVDHTVGVTVTPDAGTNIVRAYLDGVLKLTWVDTSALVPAGNPGFEYVAWGEEWEGTSFDDWQDSVDILPASNRRRRLLACGEG